MKNFIIQNTSLFNLKQKLENEFFDLKQEIIKKLFFRELKKDLKLEISSDWISRFSSLDNDYFIGFENKNICISDFYPLFEKQIKILEIAIKKELEFLYFKLEKLEKYLEFKIEENKKYDFCKDKKCSVVNSLWEDITDKKEDIDELEYTIKFLINYLEKKEIFKLEKLKFHKKYKEKVWEIFFDNSREKLVTNDFFVNECEILSYNRVIFREIFEVKDFYENRKKYEQDFFNHFIWKKDKFINIAGIYVETLFSLEDRLKILEKENKKVWEGEKEDIKKSIEKIKNSKKKFIIVEYENFYEGLLKEKFSLEDLEELLIELVIKKYSLNKEQIKILKNLCITTNITFGNYKWDSL